MAATAREKKARATPWREGLAAPLAQRLAVFEHYFADALPPATTSPERLHAAIRYTALSPGKRVRALLALTTCEAVGGSWERALPAAAAVECVHAFSLAHDDLPAMDDDDYRRGQPTTHKQFGEAYGVLAGDALLALAFEELSQLTELGLPPAKVLTAIHALARAAGSHELIAGQALDLEAEGRPVSADQVRAIHVRKTGALIAAAMVLGAIAGGATVMRLELVEDLGRRLGLAFQIHDDLLNRASSLARLGKRAGTDDARGKATYPRAVGDAQASAELQTLYLDALERIRKLGKPAWNLGTLTLALAERER